MHADKDGEIKSVEKYGGSRGAKDFVAWALKKVHELALGRIGEKAEELAVAPAPAPAPAAKKADDEEGEFYVGTGKRLRCAVMGCAALRWVNQGAGAGGMCMGKAEEAVHSTGQARPGRGELG
jgi:hypothetical protein